MAGGGGAQISSLDGPTVWTIEIIKVKPGKFGPTLGYLDDNWTRLREEAKRQGVVLTYNRIAEEGVSEDSEDSPIIMLLTEYKNKAAYESRDKIYTSILKQLPDISSGVLRLYHHDDLYETVSTRVYNDYTGPHTARLRLLAKN